MDTFILLLSLVAILYIFYILKNNNSKSSKLPPGPKPYPIIGNILELGQNPHKSLTNLSKIYGPLMRLKLGSLTTVVISSPEIAKLVLQKHDQIFSNRMTPQSTRALNHREFSVAWMPVDNQWRKLRRICKEQLFSNTRLDASQDLRREKLNQLYEYVNGCRSNNQVVDIGRAAFITSLNLVSSTLFSIDIAAYGSDSRTSQELNEIVFGIMELLGKPNLADYFPFLRWADPQGILKKNTGFTQRCFNIFDEIIGKRLEDREASGGSKSRSDMLETLLDVNQKSESELSIEEMKHLFIDILVAGTDTSSSTVEWAMTELVRNPKKMERARTEIRTLIGKNEHIHESDIPNLPYLRAVIKEIFRLHPVVPFLLPHKSTEDIEINGYIIPKNSQILTNIYAMGRDSKLWSNPNEFMPERFLDQEIDFRGQYFELIPFGAGRRICPGMPLADRMVHLMVATLVHNFDWKLENGLKSDTIDVTEHFGLSLQKATPIMAVPFKL